MVKKRFSGSGKKYSYQEKVAYHTSVDMSPKKHGVKLNSPRQMYSMGFDDGSVGHDMRLDRYENTVCRANCSCPTGTQNEKSRSNDLFYVSNALWFRHNTSLYSEVYKA